MKEYHLDIYGNWIPVKQISLSEKLDKRFFNKLRKEVLKNASKKVNK